MDNFQKKHGRCRAGEGCRTDGDPVTAVKEERAQQMLQADADYRDTAAPVKEERG